MKNIVYFRSTLKNNALYTSIPIAITIIHTIHSFKGHCIEMALFKSPCDVSDMNFLLASFQPFDNT
ncbi:hypothetical protein DERP_009487 [Dermatophagoides pteronyssinus]|uniref:Uncharacterized protein n=1 Tax=Dermatophagoides pteronyssinus TaxID=6956 RepID=A0ABQ8IUA3_DERPT|nr:hypothetical protein DERP_009487 [Dermatophagoides pteronyssinus]